MKVSRGNGTPYHLWNTSLLSSVMQRYSPSSMQILGLGRSHYRKNQPYLSHSLHHLKDSALSGFHGISSALQYFQKRISESLQNLSGVVCMMDYILVYGQDQDENDHRLIAVLNISSKPKLCSIRRNAVLLLTLPDFWVNLCNMSRSTEGGSNQTDEKFHLSCRSTTISGHGKPAR